MCYFSVTVLGRVDEKCAHHEQQDTSECGEESTEIKADQAQHANAADVLVQELQHEDVNTELSCQCTEEKLQGKCCFIAS